MKEFYAVIKARYKLGELHEQRHNLAFVDVPKDQLRALAHQLCHQDGYTHLVLLTAVDWIEERTLPADLSSAQPRSGA